MCPGSESPEQGCTDGRAGVPQDRGGMCQVLREEWVFADRVEKLFMKRAQETCYNVVLKSN